METILLEGVDYKIWYKNAHTKHVECGYMWVSESEGPLFVINQTIITIKVTKFQHLHTFQTVLSKYSQPKYFPLTKFFVLAGISFSDEFGSNQWWLCKEI